jgi:hypothetical protein
MRFPTTLANKRVKTYSIFNFGFCLKAQKMHTSMYYTSCLDDADLTGDSKSTLSHDKIFVL